MIEDYLQLWECSDPLKIASTATSDLFLVNYQNSKAVIKLLNTVGVLDEGSGRHYLNLKNSIGSVKLFKSDDKALLIEYLPGDNLYQFSKSGNEAQADKVFCQIIKKIHLKRPRDFSFEKLDSYLDIYSKIMIPKELEGILTKGQGLFEELLKTQREEVLLHGDLHHENIRSRMDGEFVCYDPKGILGDPHYEVATTLKNPWDYPEISRDKEEFKRRASFFSRELNWSYDRIVQFAFCHCCLSIAWAIDDKGSYDHQLKVAQMIEGTL